jgi:hypothetical protein
VTAATSQGTLAGALLQLAEQGQQIEQLRQAVAKIQDQLTGDRGADGVPYRPIPAPRWWLLDGDARQEAVARLRSWVEDIYQPGYGHLAARLPHCWPQHPLCLYALDWLSELHLVLYLQPARTPAMLSAQADWQARLLPAVADLMTAECARCDHTRWQR